MASASDETEQGESSLQDNLLSAIDEEVDKLGLSSPPGARPIAEDFAKKRAEPMRERITRMVRKPRTLVLLVLLLAAVVQLAFLQFSEQHSEALEQKRLNETRAQPVLRHE